MDTCFNYCSPETAYFSSDERRWINKIRKLKLQRPDEVEILKQPEENDGCIYCKIPTHYLRLQAKREVTEEQREQAKERLAKIRSEQ